MSSDSGTGRLFAVGDIHGCADELVALVDALAPVAGDVIVFLGDYIDRGPGSRAVVDYLLALREGGGAGTVFLRGNHEDMLLSFLGESGRHGEVFLRNGGNATLASYGVAAHEGIEAIYAALPPAHLAFFRGLHLWERRNPYLFVHAGIVPGRSLEEQDEEDLLWIRDEFLRKPHQLPETVVFGHTPLRDVLFQPPWKIGLDTGCVYGRMLSGLDFTGETLLQVQRGSCAVTRRSVSDELRACRRS